MYVLEVINRQDGFILKKSFVALFFDVLCKFHISISLPFWCRKKSCLDATQIERKNYYSLFCHLLLLFIAKLDFLSTLVTC